MHDSELRTVFSIEEEDDHLKGFMFASCMKLFQKKLTSAAHFIRRQFATGTESFYRNRQNPHQMMHADADVT